ncbi:hypothetical protein Y032_0105g3687 [Ancylostoma ceylanicum]|uniref:Uncharacterized protein n=1 Tax=Ancylostoma ceylanicum TaxID=53326 RepID=A0A016TG96_9BILA|nr:hypothetical protein Y032_0105g3687 [Ancylostoma ceylanicum]
MKKGYPGDSDWCIRAARHAYLFEFVRPVQKYTMYHGIDIVRAQMGGRYGWPGSANQSRLVTPLFLHDDIRPSHPNRVHF